MASKRNINQDTKAALAAQHSQSAIDSQDPTLVASKLLFKFYLEESAILSSIDWLRPHFS